LTGRVRDARSARMAEFVKVAQVSDVPPGTGKCVEANGRQIAVFNVDGMFHAIEIC
jgi:nitrite reductase/ring-hydroxylating ferredoxin subunit